MEEVVICQKHHHFIQKIRRIQKFTTIIVLVLKVKRLNQKISYMELMVVKNVNFAKNLTMKANSSNQLI